MKKLKTKKSKKENANLLQLIKEQSDRICELREENTNLLLALENYRKKEKEIADLVSFAKKQSEDIKQEAKIAYALECERIKLYRQKWQDIIISQGAEGLASSYEKTLSTLKLCQKEMEEMLANDLGEDMKDYLSERKRLDDEPILDYGAIINDQVSYGIDSLSDEEIAQLLSQL